MTGLDFDQIAGRGGTNRIRAKSRSHQDPIELKRAEMIRWKEDVSATSSGHQPFDPPTQHQDSGLFIKIAPSF